jgi:prepilin signal peptidase PulO-like enzyme (type II secretory pathway)
MEVLIALLGLAIGLLINVLADRLPHREPPGWPVCPQCGYKRPFQHWLALTAVPLGAWNCPQCGAARGLRPIMVEFASAAAAVLIFEFSPQGFAFAKAMAVASFFLLVVVTDIEHRLILHAVTIPAAVVFLIFGSLTPAKGFLTTVFGGLAGFWSVYLLYLLGSLFAYILAKIRKQELDEIAFGFGDVTLSGVIGLIIGWPGVILSLLVGVMLAGAFSLLYILTMVALRRYNPFQPIPYGPFLVVGASLTFFGGADLFRLLVNM